MHTPTLCCWRCPSLPARYYCPAVRSCRTKARTLSLNATRHPCCSCTIRPANQADVARLASVEQLCGEFSAHWSAADIKDELNKDISHVLVAAHSSNDEPLGYIVGWLIAGELQVLELAVDPAHQSKGIGSMLLGGLMQQCGCHTEGTQAVLEVKSHNARAIRLYRKHGFVDVGLRRKYYNDGSDALLMAWRPQCDG